jgi:hypothetical protein
LYLVFLHECSGQSIEQSAGTWGQHPSFGLNLPEPFDSLSSHGFGEEDLSDSIFAFSAGCVSWVAGDLVCGEEGAELFVSVSLVCWHVPAETESPKAKTRHNPIKTIRFHLI